MKNVLPEALKQLINFLEELEKTRGVKYYLVGGILANIYTIFRMTQDIDFVIDIQSKDIQIDELINLLAKYEFNPLQDWNSTLILARETKLIQYFDKANSVKYDNYLVDRLDKSKFKKLGPLGLERRVREKLFGIECWVSSKEDFILGKLVFGGWQDYSDALGCWLRFKDELDLEYLRNTSKLLDVQREYELLESGIDDPDEYFEKLEKK